MKRGTNRNETIYVLHEYGDKNHFIALEKYAFERGIEVAFFEFGILKKILKSILRFDISLLMKQVLNILFVFSLPFKTSHIVVLGIAPFDYRLLFLKKLLLKHSVYLMTSWGCWDGSFHPKNKFSDYNLVKSEWKKFIEKQINGVFAVTENVKKSLMCIYSIECPVQVVYHSIDKEFTPPLLIKKDWNKLLFVGRITREKGVKKLLQIIDLLPKQYSITIVGNGILKNESDQTIEIKHPRIMCLGHIKSKTQLSKIYSQHDFLLLPSIKNENWEELFGMVIIEGMYHGVIPVTSNHIGPSEIIENGKNGFIFEEEIYIDKCIELIKKIPKRELEIISQSAIKRSRDFKSEFLAKKWGEVLNGNNC